MTGEWSCSTAGGSTVRSIFTVAPNGDVDEHQDWINGKVGGTWDQSFIFDPNAGVWNVTNSGSNGWVFTGTTQGAVGNVVLITGSQTEGSQKVTMRERFIFETPASFQHTWEQQAADGSWKPTSYAECQLVKS